MPGASYALLARSLGANDVDAAVAALAPIAHDPAFVPTLRRHQLVGLLVGSVPEDALRACLPAETLAALGEQYDRVRATPRDSLRTLAEIQDALGREGLECMLLKGVYLAQRLYGDLERRTQYDVDVAVRERAFRSARRILRQTGWTERWRDLHSVSWARDTESLDLHSCFRRAPIYALDEDRIWTDRVAYAIDGVAFTTPSDEDTLVLLALSLFQDLGLGSAKLRQLLDLYLLAADIDARFAWPVFFARRLPEGTLEVAVNVLDLTLRVFDAAPVLPRLSDALAPHRALIAAPERAQALALALADRGAAANKGWFFAVYPGSLTWYWLWLLPRKLLARLAGRAPRRGKSALVPGVGTLRALMRARRTSARF
jgi:hypothetical protein